MASFERQVDPDGTLPPAERDARAATARKAYMAQLASKSWSAEARARRPALRSNTARLAKLEQRIVLIEDRLSIDAHPTEGQGGAAK
jgi:hypothetical protein